MDEDLVLDDDPNTLYHKMESTVTICKFKYYIKNMSMSESIERVILLKQVYFRSKISSISSIMNTTLSIRWQFKGTRRKNHYCAIGKPLRWK